MAVFSLIPAIVIIIVFITIIIIAVKIASKREQNIYVNGLEAKSVVIRCVQEHNDDGNPRYRSYVKYIGNDGAEHEALLNVQTNLPVGRVVHVKYLPGKYDEVVFVSQVLR